MTSRTLAAYNCSAWASASKLLSTALIAVAMLTLAGCGEKKAKFNAMDVTGAPWGQSYSLPDLSGKVVTTESFRGKVTAVFFGFMFCPDACPTHLTRMQEVRRLLGKDAEKLQLVFITVDPERDTPEKLSKYLQSFDPNIVGLRGSVQETEAIAKDFRVFYKKVPTKESAKDPMAYTIDHTTFTYIYDTQGKLRLVAPHDLTAAQIATDLRHLITR